MDQQCTESLNHSQIYKGNVYHLEFCDTLGLVNTQYIAPIHEGKFQILVKSNPTQPLVGLPDTEKVTSMQKNSNIFG